MKKLKDSLRLMRKANSHSGHHLDVCYLQTTVSQYSEKVVVYYMTLLAHAAVHQKIKMVELLIKEGASKSNCWAHIYTVKKLVCETSIFRQNGQFQTLVRIK